MSSTEIGRRAEQAAANYLVRQGYTILEHNWRTRWCEIDLIARKNGVVYFVEVKYRRSIAYGTGFDYITERKVQQMHFAAEFWIAAHPRVASEYGLMAIELTHTPPEVTEMVEIS
jgi:uncharacterized protein (TIGR00252 family)